MTRDVRAAVVAPMPECWRQIGTSGDRTCPELDHVVHCHNCPVLAEAARRFFDRPPPAGYLEEWTAVLAEAPAAESGRLAGSAAEVRDDSESVLIFSLADEWFALPVGGLVEVTESRRVHAVPHRTGGPLEGLVNIRGQLHLCISLAHLLRLSPPQPSIASASSRERLVVAEHAGDRWAFRVDRIAGIPAVPRPRLRPVPDTARIDAGGHATALFEQDGLVVALLAPQSIFEGLADRLGMDTARRPS